MYSPAAQNAPVNTKQIQRSDQNLRQKQAVYNRKISEYTHVAWKGTKISQCFGVRSLSYQSNQGIKITKMTQNMEETRIPQVLQPTDKLFQQYTDKHKKTIETAILTTHDFST